MFDNPWVVVVIVVISALANWLSKRREAKQADQQPEGDEPATESGKPPAEFNLEDALRRLMGEEKPAPAPPPLAHAIRGSSSSEPEWEEEEEPFQPVRQTVPPLLPPVISAAQTSFTATVVSEQLKEAARRFEQSSVQRSQPATVVRHSHGYRSRTGKRSASQWRDPRSARRAFVASLVFGTPKGLES